MQFAVLPKVFRAALQLVQQAAASYNDAVLPALTGVLIESEGGTLRLTSTNLSNSLSTTVPLAGHNGAHINAIVDATVLIQLLAALPAKQKARFSYDDTALMLACFNAAGRYTQTVDPGSDFPRPKPVLSFGNRATLPTQQLAKALRTVLPFVLTKTNTAYASHNAVLIRLAGSVATLQATSGFSAASTQIRFIETSGPAALLLPLASAKLLLAQLELQPAGDVVVNWSEASAEFNFGHPLVRLSAQLVDDTMPDIDNLFLPDAQRRTVVVSRASLQSTLQRLKSYTKAKARLRFTANRLTVEAAYPEFEYEGQEWLSAQVQEGAELAPININLPFLLKMMDSLDTEEVELSVSHLGRGMLRVLPGMESAVPLLYNTGMALSTLPEEVAEAVETEAEVEGN